MISALKLCFLFFRICLGFHSKNKPFSDICNHYSNFFHSKKSIFNIFSYICPEISINRKSNPLTEIADDIEIERKVTLIDLIDEAQPHGVTERFLTKLLTYRIAFLFVLIT